MTKYPKDGRVYIDHILLEIKDIEEFTGNGERDIKTYKAVIRCFEVIGEATVKMPDDFKNKYSNVPWTIMIAMRNVLIHDYLGIDNKDLWDTVENDIPILKEKLLKLQEELL